MYNFHEYAKSGKRVGEWRGLQVYALYKSAHGSAAKAYELKLRFDGSGTGSAFNEEEYFPLKLQDKYFDIKE